MISEFIDLQTSSTVFLEKKFNALLNVTIESISIDDNIIERKTVLSFNKPVLYAVSKFYRQNLTSFEQEMLKSTIPLGKIFDNVVKKDFKIFWESDFNVAKKLQTSNNRVCKKQYEFFVNNKHYATIVEMFNADTIC